MAVQILENVARDAIVIITDNNDYLLFNKSVLSDLSILTTLKNRLNADPTALNGLVAVDQTKFDAVYSGVSFTDVTGSY